MKAAIIDGRDLVENIIEVPDKSTAIAFGAVLVPEGMALGIGWAWDGVSAAAAPPPEPAPDVNGIVLSPTQFHAALDYNGLAARIEAAIDGIADAAERANVRARLNHSQAFHRDDPLVASLAAAIGLTDSELDDLWLAATNFV